MHVFSTFFFFYSIQAISFGQLTVFGTHAEILTSTLVKFWRIYLVRLCAGEESPPDIYFFFVFMWRWAKKYVDPENESGN